MQISSRFTLAVHIFACIDTFQNEYKVTSDFIAGSTNVNPVIIRKILLQLKAAGLVRNRRNHHHETFVRDHISGYLQGSGMCGRESVVSLS